MCVSKVRKKIPSHEQNWIKCMPTSWKTMQLQKSRRFYSRGEENGKANWIKSNADGLKASRFTQIRHEHNGYVQIHGTRNVHSLADERQRDFAMGRRPPKQICFHFDANGEREVERNGKKRERKMTNRLVSRYFQVSGRESSNKGDENSRGKRAK